MIKKSDIETTTSLKTRFFQLILLFLCFVPHNAHGESKSVALVISLPETEVSIPMLEFYRATVDAISISPDYKVVDDSSFVAVLQRRQRPRAPLGAIGHIDKQIFYAAHPNALSPSLQLQTRSPLKLEKKDDGHIQALQAALDTSTLDAAIIVDCIAENSHQNKSGSKMGGASKAKLSTTSPLLQSCGIYFYDRQAAKVIAQSRKYFRTAIQDARNWAVPLVAGLSHGMKSAKNQAEKAEVEKALYENSQSLDDSLLLLEITGSGQSMNEPTGSIASLPLAKILVGQHVKGFTLGVQYDYGKASTKNDKAATSYREEALGIHFGVGARALATLLWDLGMETSLAKRRWVEQKSEAISASTDIMAVRSLKFAVGPGLLWEVSKGFAVGGEVRFLRYVPLSREIEGLSSSQDFNKSSLGMGIRFRKTF